MSVAPSGGSHGAWPSFNPTSNQQQPQPHQGSPQHQSVEKPRSPSPRSDLLAIPDGAFGFGFGFSGGGGGDGGGGGGGWGGHGLATSPTSLTVPQWFSSGGGADTWRRVSSASSSIFDLSAECDQLERAIRDNDVLTVKKFLQIHHGKFPVDLALSFLDKSSCDSRRHSHVSQDVEILLLKSQTLIESLGRKESVATESDVPYIFRTSLHLAVQHAAHDVLKLLLKFGVDPNEPSGQVSFGPPGGRSRRASSVNPEVLMHHLQQLHIQRQLLLQQQRQQQQQPQDAMSWDRRSRLSCCSQLNEPADSSLPALPVRVRSKSCSPTVPPAITFSLPATSSGASATLTSDDVIGDGKVKASTPAFPTITRLVSSSVPHVTSPFPTATSSVTSPAPAEMPTLTSNEGNLQSMTNTLLTDNMQMTSSVPTITPTVTTLGGQDHGGIGRVEPACNAVPTNNCFLAADGEGVVIRVDSSAVISDSHQPHSARYDTDSYAGTSRGARRGSDRENHSHPVHHVHYAAGQAGERQPCPTAPVFTQHATHTAFGLPHSALSTAPPRQPDTAVAHGDSSHTGNICAGTTTRPPARSSSAARSVVSASSSVPASSSVSACSVVSQSLSPVSSGTTVGADSTEQQAARRYSVTRSQPHIVTDHHKQFVTENQKLIATENQRVNVTENHRLNVTENSRLLTIGVTGPQRDGHADSTRGVPHRTTHLIPTSPTTLTPPGPAPFSSSGHPADSHNHVTTSAAASSGRALNVFSGPQVIVSADPSEEVAQTREVVLPGGEHSLGLSPHTARGGEASPSLPVTSSDGVRSSVSRLQLPEIVETESECCGQGQTFDIATAYTGPGAEDLFSLPPIFTAVLEGRVRAVRLLLRYGACPHVTDRHGCTPLHLACTPEFLNPDCVYLLLRAGAKVNVANCAGLTPYLLYPNVAEDQRNLVTTALSRIPQPQPPGKKSSGLTHIIASAVASNSSSGPTMAAPTTSSQRPATPGSEHGASQHSTATQRSGSVSRFFKRLSSESRSRGRERKITRDDSSTTGMATTTATPSNFTSATFSDMRERASSLSSCKSLRSRHHSSAFYDELEFSDISFVSTYSFFQNRHL